MKKFGLFFICIMTLFLCTQCRNAKDLRVSFPRGNGTEELIRLGFISEADAENPSDITNLEALTILSEICDNTSSSFIIREWYAIDALEPLDNLPDSTKEILLSLTNVRKNILKIEEIPDLALNEPITEYQMLVYCTRMIGDTDSCVGSSDVLNFKTKKETYENAVQKKLISDYAVQNADLPVSRISFYELLYRTMATPYMVGGAGGVETTNYLDSIKTRTEIANEPEPVVPSSPLSVPVLQENDGSFRWELPDDTLPFIENAFCTCSLMGKDGKILYNFMTSGPIQEISATTLLETLLSSNSENADSIRITYELYNTENIKTEEKILTIPLTNFLIVTEGAPVEPGVYTCKKDCWPFESLTLKKENFEPNTYYILTGYEHKYRKPEYNTVDKCVFLNKKAAKTYIPLEDSGSVGVSHPEEVRLQKASFSGSAKTGFTLKISPESKTTFKIREIPNS